jgi:pimeloyl-ACP methyl ester carboxylesterase
MERMTRRRAVRALVGLTAAVAIGSTSTIAGAAPHHPSHDELRPVVFVHGQSGSAQQFETQAMRFTSNGYPQDLLFAFEYDTSVPTNPIADLDSFLDGVLDQTGADGVFAIGHSRGTSVWTQYLDDPAFDGPDKVAKYVNVDGRSPADLPGGVPTIGIWGEWNTADSGYNIRGNVNAQIGPDPADNYYFGAKSHTEVMTSAEAFGVMYEFLTGDAPATTDVVPEPPGRVSISGRAVIFPENAGADGTSLDVWRVDAATGQRIGDRPIHSQPIDASGVFGPVNVNGLKSYELALTRTDGSVHHFYFEPFSRSDHFLRLNTSEPGEGLEAFIPRSELSSGFVVSRQREFWGDQGAGSDQLLVDGLDVLNSITSPRTAVNLAVFGFDADLDQTTDLTRVPFPFGIVTFITAADVYIPADVSAAWSFSVTDVARGSGDASTINVPAWPSIDNRVTVQFRDDDQEVQAFPGPRAR